MDQLEYRQYLIKKQKDLLEEGRNARDFTAIITYRCLINLLEEVLEKFDTIED